MRDLGRHALQFLRNAGVGRDDAVIVACSGGPDSAVLAEVVMGLSQCGDLGRVHLVYVDHQLRPDSAADGRVVEALADAGGASFHQVAVKVDRTRASLEAAARDVRYQALRKAARTHGISWVLLAHTATDQAETVFMRILRGTGLVGLSGIPPRRGRYLRPFINITREEIVEYADENDTPTVIDPMNDEGRFLRNRVRNDHLPALREENPQIDDALRRLADAAREQRAVLDYAADVLVTRARRPQEGHSFSIEPLLAAPAPVVKRAIAGAAQSAGSPPLEARHLEAVVVLIGAGCDGTVSLDLPGLRVIREYDVLRLIPATSRPATEDELTQVVGSDGPYTVRRWQPGDRMRPARLKGRSKKLSDLFIDQKVPREQRSRARVVTRQGDGEIVWAEHVGPAFGADIQVSLTSRDLVSTKN